MALNAIERCAGRHFRAAAGQVLQASLADQPDSAACSSEVRFYRHECPAVKGRTRSIRLDDQVLTSPELWVYWNKGDPYVITEEQAEAMLAAGPVEYEVVLAGKFSFTWKSGYCRRCELRVMSRKGVLKDARPDKGIEQDDLATYTQPYAWRQTAGIRREIGIE